MRVRDDKDKIELSYCNERYSADYNNRRSDGTVVVARQLVSGFYFADPKSNTHPNLD